MRLPVGNVQDGSKGHPGLSLLHRPASASGCQRLSTARSDPWAGPVPHWSSSRRCYCNEQAGLEAVRSLSGLCVRFVLFFLVTVNSTSTNNKARISRDNAMEQELEQTSEVDQSFDQTVLSICEARQVALTPATPSLIAVGGHSASPEETGPSVVSGQGHSSKTGQQTESTLSSMFPLCYVPRITLFVRLCLWSYPCAYDDANTGPPRSRVMFVFDEDVWSVFANPKCACDEYCGGKPRPRVLVAAAGSPSPHLGTSLLFSFCFFFFFGIVFFLAH